MQNEIVENLKDVENVFRPNVMDPLALTAPTPEETVSDEHLFFKMEKKIKIKYFN
jgi:hypothetical protein